MLEGCRVSKLEGAMNKGVIVLLLDYVFVAADYNELLFSLFWLRFFFSLICSTLFLFNTS